MKCIIPLLVVLNIQAGSVCSAPAQPQPIEPERKLVRASRDPIEYIAQQMPLDVESQVEMKRVAVAYSLQGRRKLLPHYSNSLSRTRLSSFSSTQPGMPRS